MTCEAKIRPFPNPTEVRCELPDDGHAKHQATLRDYAYPGSATTMDWFEDDRRTFRGEWTHCDESTCILPAGHQGRHAA